MPRKTGVGKPVARSQGAPDPVVADPRKVEEGWRRRTDPGVGHEPEPARLESSTQFPLPSSLLMWASSSSSKSQPKAAPVLPCTPRLPAVSKNTTARLAALVEIHLKGPIHSASLRQCSLYPQFWTAGGPHALQPLGTRGCIPDSHGESGLVSRGSKGLCSPFRS